MDATDAQLYDRAVVGDRTAVRTIVERYHHQLIAYGRASGWRDGEVQDAAQIAWMNFFRLIEAVRRGTNEGLREPDRLRFWLVSTMRNALHDEYRRAKRRDALFERAAVATGASGAITMEPDFLAGVELEEQRSVVRRVFERLGQTCRELLALLLIDPPLPYTEVAEAMDKPVGSIGPTRQRCIDQVRSLIAEAT